MESKTIIRVRYANGAYTTNTVRGQRASCTHSAKEAALALARKLAPDQVRFLKHQGSSACVDIFELEVTA